MLPRRCVRLESVRPVTVRLIVAKLLMAPYLAIVRIADSFGNALVDEQCIAFVSLVSGTIMLNTFAIIQSM